MAQSETQFSKCRWLLILVGLFLYVGDIGTDTALAWMYFHESQYTWTGLTVMFILIGMLVTQTFSFAWFWDDMGNGEQSPSKRTFTALHLFGMGIFTRYYQLLKEGKKVWMENDSKTAEFCEMHCRLFNMASDLSMLKLFESFLESAPQLLLQLYIQGFNEWPLLRIISVAFSFCNMAWSLVDYRICLRRSLNHISEMPSGLPTVVYLIYKLGTIASVILSYSLLLTLSVYSTIAFTFIWLLGTLWAHWLQTDFCTSRTLELLYRAVVGVILVFSFFNVKGQNTKIAMFIFYFSHSVLSVIAPLLLAVYKPELQNTVYFWTICGLVSGGLLVGLLCLVLYYRFLHSASEPDIQPRESDVHTREPDFYPRVPDEVDGPNLKPASSPEISRTFF